MVDVLSACFSIFVVVVVDDDDVFAGSNALEDVCRGFLTCFLLLFLVLVSTRVLFLMFGTY